MLIFHLCNILAPEREGKKEEDSPFMVLAPDLVRIIENAILTFRSFLKMDKKKSNGVLHLLRTQNQFATPLQRVQSLLEKVGIGHLIWPHHRNDLMLLIKFPFSVKAQLAGIQLLIFIL